MRYERDNGERKDTNAREGKGREPRSRWGIFSEAAGRGREAGLYYFILILFPFLSFGGVWFTHFTHFTYIREGRIRILRCIYLFSHSTFARSSIRLARVIKINKGFLIFFIYHYRCPSLGLERPSSPSRMN